MEFKKIKYTRTGGLELKYVRVKTLSEDVLSKTEVVEKCKDEPHPDLLNALQSLKSIIAYDEGYDKKAEINVTGVSLFNDHETVIISHTKTINSGATNRNSGRVSFESEEFEKVDELFKIVNTIVKEATAYVADGKRAQLSIFSEEEKEEKKTNDLKVAS